MTDDIQNGPFLSEFQEERAASDEKSSTDRGFKGSLFRSQFAPNVKPIAFASPEALARTIRTITAPTKAALPWIKLALFSGERTKNDCCRCDAFVTTLTGAEGDYDAGEITVLDAALWLQAAGVEAIVGETASSTPEAPRWRVWLPASREYTATPHELRTLRQRWVARANGVLNGKLAGESFTLSQSYYIGGIKGRPRPTVIVTRGRRIDLCDDLDTDAMFKNGTSNPTARTRPAVAFLDDDPIESDHDPRLLREGLSRKKNFHKTKGHGTGPLGHRVCQLIQWLGDMATEDGLIASAEMISEILGDDYETPIHEIERLLAKRQDPRGCDVIDEGVAAVWQFQDDDAAVDAILGENLDDLDDNNPVNRKRCNV
jgi:hypothetical protein